MVRQDDRAPFAAALEPARRAAFAPAAYVGQESFMTADEIRQLADRAGIGSGTSVLDVCCGIAGPGRLIVAERGCGYLGLDYSVGALELAGILADGLSCRFEPAHVPPLPAGEFDVVLLLETMLAFSDKHALLDAVARALRPGGRFAFTVEVGRPLSDGEREHMPDADTVHLVELAELEALLAEAGLDITWQQDHTASHHAVATALLESFCRHSADIASTIGSPALTDLIAAHQLWSDWLRCGRVRKFALVALKQ